MGQTSPPLSRVRSALTTPKDLRGIRSPLELLRGNGAVNIRSIAAIRDGLSRQQGVATRSQQRR